MLSMLALNRTHHLNELEWIKTQTKSWINYVLITSDSEYQAHTFSLLGKDIYNTINTNTEMDIWSLWQTDNLQCCQWRNYCQKIFISVTWTVIKWQHLEYTHAIRFYASFQLSARIVFGSGLAVNMPPVILWWPSVLPNCLHIYSLLDLNEFTTIFFLCVMFSQIIVIHVTYRS